MFEIKLNKDELGNAFCVRVLRESQQIFFLFCTFREIMDNRYGGVGWTLSAFARDESFFGI
jgi:hypothetical protein